jgi:hypothetical protein
MALLQAILSNAGVNINIDPENVGVNIREKPTEDRG